MGFPLLNRDSCRPHLSVLPGVGKKGWALVSSGCSCRLAFHTEEKLCFCEGQFDKNPICICAQYGIDLLQGCMSLSFKFTRQQNRGDRQQHDFALLRWPCSKTKIYEIRNWWTLQFLFQTIAGASMSVYCLRCANKWDLRSRSRRE